MNASVSEHRVVHLHQKVIRALTNSTAAKPVSQNELRKLAEPVVGGMRVLDQFLEQLIADKAISRSSGMREGVSHVAYWATSNLGAIAARVNAASAREFTVAEKGLIRKVHGWMPAQQLLAMLNERLVCDLGPDAVPYQMKQLYSEIGDATGATAASGHDWPSLRKLLAKAERDGVLSVISEQTINDFAVVYSLNSKQVMVLKDIILQTKEEE